MATWGIEVEGRLVVLTPHADEPDSSAYELTPHQAEALARALSYAAGEADSNPEESDSG